MPDQEEYDPNKLNPLSVPGGTWSSMAPAIVPALLGLLTGGVGGGIAGLAGGASGIQGEREKNIQYNNQLQIRKQQQQNEQQRLLLEQNQDARQEKLMQANLEQHAVALKEAQRAYDENLKTDAGRAKIRQSIQDPEQQALFDAYPKEWGAVKMENVKRADLVHRWTADGGAMLRKYIDIPPGVDPVAVANAFGDKIPEFMERQQTAKETNRHDLAQEEIARGHLALARAEANKSTVQFSMGGELVAITKPGEKPQIKPTSEFLGQNYVSTKAYGDAVEDLQKLWKDPLSRQGAQTFDEFVALPGNQNYIALKLRAIDPQTYINSTAKIVKDRQRIEDGAVKDLRKQWEESLWFGRKGTDEQFEKYKVSDQGQKMLGVNRQRRELTSRNFSAPVNPTKEDLAPAYEGRPVVKNPDGSWSHEKSITIEADGKHMNIPTMFGGKAVSPDQAVEIMRKNKWVDPDTGKPIATFKTHAEAVKAAQTKEAKQQQVPQSGKRPSLDEIFGQ